MSPPCAIIHPCADRVKRTGREGEPPRASSSPGSTRRHVATRFQRQQDAGRPVPARARAFTGRRALLAALRWSRAAATSSAWCSAVRPGVTVRSCCRRSGWSGCLRRAPPCGSPAARTRPAAGCAVLLATARPPPRHVIRGAAIAARAPAGHGRADGVPRLLVGHARDRRHPGQLHDRRARNDPGRRRRGGRQLYRRLGGRPLSGRRRVTLTAARTSAHRSTTCWLRRLGPGRTTWSVAWPAPSSTSPPSASGNPPSGRSPSTVAVDSASSATSE